MKTETATLKITFTARAKEAIDADNDNPLKAIINFFNSSDFGDSYKFKLITAKMKDGQTHTFITHVYADDSGEFPLEEVKGEHDTAAVLNYISARDNLLGCCLWHESGVEIAH